MGYEVYCHTHRESKKRYVGQTRVGMYARWDGHVKSARRGEPFPFSRAIRKYGPDAFEHTLLEVVSTTEKADLAERFWIAHFNSTNRAVGYNLDAGGKAHNTHPQTRARLSKAASKRRHTAESKAKIGLANVGRQHSAEARDKIRAARRGTKMSAAQKEKIAASLRGRSLSETTRLKISAALAGVKRGPRKRSPPSEQTRVKIATALRGLKPSSETRLRMSLSRKGKKHSEDTKRKMVIAQQERRTREETIRGMG